jgi:hypothetical protein
MGKTMDNERKDQMDVYFTPQGLVDKLSGIATASEMATYSLVNPPFTTGLRELARPTPRGTGPIQG